MQPRITHCMTDENSYRGKIQSNNKKKYEISPSKFFSTRNPQNKCLPKLSSQDYALKLETPH